MIDLEGRSARHPPYSTLMSETGMTRMPTSMSATASERRKKFVAFCSFFSRDTARMTRMFPPMVRRMMTRISRAGQFFSFMVILGSVWLWLRLTEVFPCQAVSTPSWHVSSEVVVEPKPTDIGLLGLPFIRVQISLLLVAISPESTGGQQ